MKTVDKSCKYVHSLCEGLSTGIYTEISVQFYKYLKYVKQCLHWQSVLQNGCETAGDSDTGCPCLGYPKSMGQIEPNLSVLH